MNVNNVIEYATTLIGIPYLLWTGKETTDVFHCDKIPLLETLYSSGVNCAGFINILILFSGGLIPNSNNSLIPRGGTGFWLTEYTKRNVLKKIDYNKSYPIGTLLFRSYKNSYDQGHFAIIVDNIISNPKVIHSYSGGEGKVGITYMINEDTSTNYYEYIIYPIDWLNIIK